jgi:uncharacterized protein YceK
MKKIAKTMFLAVAVWSSGCGTVCNLSNGFFDPDDSPTMFGGLQMDFGFLEALGSTGSQPISDSGPRTNLAIVGLAILDMPMSLVGDTLTLPITAFCDTRRSGGKKAASMEGNSSPAADILNRERPQKSNQ